MNTINNTKLITIKKVDTNYIFTIPKVISRLQAMTIQKEVGYIVAKYGFHSFKSTDDKTMWSCRSTPYE